MNTEERQQKIFNYFSEEHGLSLMADDFHAIQYYSDDDHRQRVEEWTDEKLAEYFKHEGDYSRAEMLRDELLKDNK
jgi:hypothetical protein